MFGGDHWLCVKRHGIATKEHAATPPAKTLNGVRERRWIGLSPWRREPRGRSLRLTCWRKGTCRQDVEVGKHTQEDHPSHLGKREEFALSSPVCGHHPSPVCSESAPRRGKRNGNRGNRAESVKAEQGIILPPSASCTFVHRPGQHIMRLSLELYKCGDATTASLVPVDCRPCPWFRDARRPEECWPPTAKYLSGL